MELRSLAALLIFAVLTKAQNISIDRLNNSNIEKLLERSNIFNRYYNCLISDDGTSCNDLGSRVKNIFTNVLLNNCESCSDNEKALARRIGRYMMQKRPGEWQQIKQKWDPYNQYAQNIHHFFDD